jgi:zinc and cadmium transporter
MFLSLPRQKSRDAEHSDIMHLLVWIILFTLLGGVLSVVAASIFLFLPESRRVRILPHGVSFAIGALLAASFTGLIPHAFEGAESGRLHALSLTILVGILTFFLLEKLLLWRHSHTGNRDSHRHEDFSKLHPSGTLILLGDAIHNFVDGVLIGAAFLTDIHLGIVTSLAVAAHEIPQEVGDFAILLHSGYGRTKALVWNILASVTTVFGGMIAYFGLGELDHLLPYLLVFTASSFIYIAVADLLPTLNRKTDFQSSAYQILLIAAGVLMISWSHEFAH